MKKLIGLMLAVMMLTGLAFAAVAESQGSERYVCTANGKGLNVRSSMSTTEDNVVATLPYGTKVFTYGNPQPGWTYVEIGNTSGYVMSRYLVKNKPAPYDPSARPAEPAAKSGRNFDSKAATTVEQINSLLAAAKTVEPYSVTVRPVRASGWVYMRWLPSKNAKLLATYGANQELTVIAELKDWYQVQDPSNGSVGFIYKSYIQ